MIIIRTEGTNCKLQTGYKSRVWRQGHKVVISESEANTYHQTMRSAVYKSDLHEEMVCKPVANKIRTPLKYH